MEFITDESLKQKMIAKGKYIDASLVKLNIPANIVALVDKNIAQKYKILPFNYDEEHQTLYIVCNEDALLEQDEIEDIFSTRLNATIKLVLTDNYNLKEALKYYYKVDLNTQSMAHEVQENIEDNAPILNKVKNIIADAIEFGASDIHFLPYKFNNCYSIKILYRINGKNVNHSADYDFTENEIYEKLLSDKLSVNLGYLYENAVACCLAVNGNELFYHTIMNETSKHNYEIDFLLAKKNKIIPIEVKSSGYKTHKSLDIFTEKFSDRILCRYLVYTKDISKEQDIFCIPVYMVPFL